MSTVTINVDELVSLDNLGAKYREFISRKGEQLLDEASALLLNRLRTRFLQEKGPNGAPWVPSRSGLIRKSGGYTVRNGRRYTGTGTLYETGRLFRSLQLYRSNLTRMIGTDVEYAGGLNEKWKFLSFGDADVALAKAIITRYVQQYFQ
jgi:phage gpG-like protein